MNIIVVDITNFINWFTQQIKIMFGKIITIWKNIQFRGFSLFDYFITLIIAGAILQIFISHVNNIKSTNYGGKKERNKEK